VTHRTGTHTTHLGTVAFTHEPTGGGTSIEADIAIVDTTKGCGSVVSTISAAGPPATSPNAAITMHLPGGRTSDNYRGFSAYIYFPSGTFGDLHMTVAQVTNPGDSGSPVVDVNDVILGHVVGSSPGVTTYFQDADFQIKEVARLSTLSGIKL
jgi:hypothetical protein